MTGDFNIRDSVWDLNYPYHSIHRDMLFDIVDSFQLELSQSTEYFPTRYSNNDWDSNSVLDLAFLHPMLSEFNSHHIYLNWRLSSDHALSPLTFLSLMNTSLPSNALSLQEVMKKNIFLKNSLFSSKDWTSYPSKALTSLKVWKYCLQLVDQHWEHLA